MILATKNQKTQVEDFAFELLLVAVNPAHGLPKQDVAAVLGLSIAEVGLLLEEGAFPYYIERESGRFLVPRSFVVRMIFLRASRNISPDTLLLQIKEQALLIRPERAQTAQKAIAILAAELNQ